MNKAKDSKPKGKKYWFTYAFLTREGQPNPVHRERNFTRWHGQISTLLSDLTRAMSSETWSKGAYVVTIWPGQIDEWQALHGAAMPLYNIYEGSTTRGPQIERI